MELSEESMAHNHRRALHYHVPSGLALSDVPERRLLPVLHQWLFPHIGRRSQRSFRNLIRVNCCLPLPRNEANPDLARTRSPGQEASSLTEGSKAPFTALNLATQEC